MNARLIWIRLGTCCIAALFLGFGPQALCQVMPVHRRRELTTLTVRHLAAVFLCLGAMLLPPPAQSQSCPSFVCAGQVIPSGCIIIQLQTISGCGSGTNNADILKSIAGEPFGAQETACEVSPIPSDWAITDTPSILACGNSDPGNARILFNLNGAQIGTIEDVCQITQVSNLPGWQVVVPSEHVQACGDTPTSPAGMKIKNVSNTPPPPPSTGDFALSVNPVAAVAVQGTTVSLVVSITRTQGFGGAVTITVSGMPPGVSAATSPNNTTGNSSSVALTVGAASPIGTFSLSITGSSGNLTHTTDFSLAVSPSWWTAIQQLLDD